MPIKDQYTLVCALVKRNPGITKRGVHRRTGIPMRTLHRRAKELALRGILAVHNGRLTLCEDLPRERIHLQITNPVFELKKRLPPDVVEKAIQWLSVKAFFGLNNRNITFQDGDVQRVIIETNGSAFSLEDCQKLWRLLKEAFKVPFQCVDYVIVVHGHDMGNPLEIVKDMEDLLEMIVQRFEDKRVILNKDLTIQKLQEEIQKLSQ